MLRLECAWFFWQPSCSPPSCSKAVFDLLPLGCVSQWPVCSFCLLILLAPVGCRCPALFLASSEMYAFPDLLFDSCGAPSLGWVSCLLTYAAVYPQRYLLNTHRHLGFLFVCLSFFLVVLEIEHKALCMQDRNSYSLSHIPNPDTWFLFDCFPL